MSTYRASEMKLVSFQDWEEAINDAVHEPNFSASNRKITELHYLLSTRLGDWLGRDAGANFHTWAVWGSHKTGVTIRQEDRDQATRDGMVVGAMTGGALGGLLGWMLAGFPIALENWTMPILWLLLGACCGCCIGFWIIQRSRHVAAQLISHGNRIVLDDIGRQTARFISTFDQVSVPDLEKLSAFHAGFNGEPSAEKASDLLRNAFTMYWKARFASLPEEKAEYTYYANCLAVLHEHHRLQPAIKGSLPWIISKCVTKRLMQFEIGPLRLAVSYDVPPLDAYPFPANLEHLRNPDLRAFLYGENGWDLSGESLENTAAKDWTKITERMRYIVKLFRVFHFSPEVWEHPVQQQALGIHSNKV